MKKVSNTKVLILFIGSILLIGGIWLVWWYVAPHYMKIEYQERISWGDSFAILNVLIAGLGFAGLLATLFLQSKQLRLQSEEIIRVQADIENQRFDSLLFNLLALHKDIVSEMVYVGNFNLELMGERSEGRTCFKYIYNDFTSLYNNTHRAYPGDIAEKIEAVYEEFYQHSYSYIGHYYRVLYNICKFIDGKPIGKDQDDDRKKYMDILKAQLSGEEILMLFYNCLSKYGRNFKPLVRTYIMIEHIKVQELVNQHQDQIVFLYGIQNDQLEYFKVKNTIV